MEAHVAAWCPSSRPQSSHAHGLSNLAQAWFGTEELRSRVAELEAALAKKTAELNAVLHTSSIVSVTAASTHDADPWTEDAGSWDVPLDDEAGISPVKTSRAPSPRLPFRSLSSLSPPSTPVVQTPRPMRPSANAIPRTPRTEVPTSSQRMTSPPPPLTPPPGTWGVGAFGSSHGEETPIRQVIFEKLAEGFREKVSSVLKPCCTPPPATDSELHEHLDKAGPGAFQPVEAQSTPPTKRIRPERRSFGELRVCDSPAKTLSPRFRLEADFTPPALGHADYSGPVPTLSSPSVLDDSRGDDLLPALERSVLGDTLPSSIAVGRSPERSSLAGDILQATPDVSVIDLPVQHAAEDCDFDDDDDDDVDARCESGDELIGERVTVCGPESKQASVSKAVRLAEGQPPNTVFFPAPPVSPSDRVYHSGHHSTWTPRKNTPPPAFGSPQVRPQVIPVTLPAGNSTPVRLPQFVRGGG